MLELSIFFVCHGVNIMLLMLLLLFLIFFSSLRVSSKAEKCLFLFFQILPLLKSWGATGLLVEYEDSFPYSEELSIIHAQDSYRY